MNREAIEAYRPMMELFFPLVGEGQRANRYMWVERETVTAAMQKRRDDGRDAVNRRWSAIRNLEGTNRSPIPDIIQEQEEEKKEKKKKNTPLPPKGAKRRSWTDVESYTEGTRQVVEELMAIWPKKQPDDRDINLDAFKMADRVQELLKNGKLTPDLLIRGAKAYLETRPKAWKAPQFFFGPGMDDEQPAWRPYVAALYRETTQENK